MLHPPTAPRVRCVGAQASLAAAVTPETYGRTFGFERMMDTLGAIVGPAAAFVLLPWVGHHDPTLFALTLIPGLMAMAAITFLVRGREPKPAPHVSFGARLRALPRLYLTFLRRIGRPKHQTTW